MQNQKFYFGLITIIAILLTALLITKLHPAPAMVTIESPNRLAMNTIAKITAVAHDEETAQSAINAAFDEVYRLEKLMNRFDPNSEISKINKFAFGKPVIIDKDLFDCLYQAKTLSKLTDGAFDITIAPLVNMWRECAEANELPTFQQLTEIKKIIGYEKLILDGNDYSVRFEVEGMSIDLGAIAKGFAADKAEEIMRAKQAVAGLIDLGGQLGCFGSNAQNNKWLIGVRNPVKKEDDGIILKLSLSDMAVATSGNYERFYTIQGRRFSHILDPQTETSAEHISSVTVLSDNGAQADALATAISVMGKEKGLELIERLENTEAIIIPADVQDKLFTTSGANEFILK